MHNWSAHILLHGPQLEGNITSDMRYLPPEPFQPCIWTSTEAAERFQCLGQACSDADGYPIALNH